MIEGTPSAGHADIAGHDHLVSSVIAVVAIAFILEAIFVTVRIYTRCRVVSTLGVDDSE